jgi:hypothetical protein
MLHSKVSDPGKRAALRTLAATFRSVVRLPALRMAKPGPKAS